MTPVPEFTVQQMSRKALQLTLDWAAREGWQPGLHDGEAFYAADPKGYFQATAKGRGGAVTDNGTPTSNPDDIENMLGSISAVAHGDRFGFIGLFIVDKSYRGHRIGSALASAALDRLGDRVIGVDGVLKKASQYKSIYGFEFAWINIRHEWRPDARKSASVPPDQVPDLEFVTISESNFAEAEQLDLKYFMAPRPEFLKHWLYPSTHEGGLALLCRQAGEPAGYGVLRPSVSGYRIGPLFAANDAAAEGLFHRLTVGLPPDAVVWMDIPDAHPEARAFAKKQGMIEMFPTARMYRGGKWPLCARNIWGITTLELG
ncbi:MAG: GNAT family N-acetyltransferase [Candidatus Methylacidiphilales bacterium]|nr:GNAT family N-acetyltransferase [Candidatus Methylacidiphilales bacterium]